MKNAAIILGFFCILAFSKVQADSLTLEKVAAAPGDTALVNLILNNSVTVGGFQFVVTPSHAGVVSFLEITAAGRAAGWTISYNTSGEGIIVVGYSSSGVRIDPGNAAVLTFRCLISPDASGGVVSLAISGLVVSDPNLNPVSGIVPVNGFISLKSKPLPSFTRKPESGTPPLKVDFDATASSDPDGSIVDYRWDFGDSTSASGIKASHTFAATGSYKVTLIVTDNDGYTGAITQTVYVYESGSYRRGDVNRDGKTDIFDLLTLLKILSDSEVDY